MTNNITRSFQNQYSITNKFADYKGSSIDVELFSSDLFEQIALINYKDDSKNIRQEVMTKRFNAFESEMLTQIPHCVGKNIKKVLLCGGLQAEIAYLFSLHNIQVDMVVGDREALYTLSGFLPHFKEITQNPLINICENFLSLKNKDYDVVLHLGVIKPHEFDALKKLANKNFILLFRLANLYLEPSIALETLANAKDHGHILMPFMLPVLTPNFYGFLSNAYHPLADLQLQISDMLDDMEFYNANIHASVFRLPTLLNKIIAPYAKN